MNLPSMSNKNHPGSLCDSGIRALCVKLLATLTVCLLSADMAVGGVMILDFSPTSQPLFGFGGLNPSTWTQNATTLSLNGTADGGLGVDPAALANRPLTDYFSMTARTLPGNESELDIAFEAKSNDGNRYTFFYIGPASSFGTGVMTTYNYAPLNAPTYVLDHNNGFSGVFGKTPDLTDTVTGFRIQGLFGPVPPLTFAWELDSFQLNAAPAAVPEPATGVVIAVGSIGLFLRRRLRAIES